MKPSTFTEAYERSPLQAPAWLARIITVIRGGCYVEIHGGQYGGDVRGRDLDDLAHWRAHVVDVYGTDGWNKVYAASYQALQSWFRYRQVQAVFREAAPAIARQEHISRYQMLSLLEISGAGLAPDPCFQAVLAPARRSPSPQPKASVASASRRPASPTGVDLQKFRA
jgi:hypothetical protein